MEIIAKVLKIINRKCEGLSHLVLSGPLQIVMYALGKLQVLICAVISSSCSLLGINREFQSKLVFIVHFIQYKHLCNLECDENVKENFTIGVIYHIDVKRCSSQVTNHSQITMHSSYTGLCLFIHLILHGSCVLGISSTKKEANSFSSVLKEIKKVNHPCRMNLKKKSADCMISGLDSVPQDLNSDIESLNLLGNKIKDLWNTSFRNYSQLIELNLQANSIFWIQEGSFYPLVNLMKLFLSWNSYLSHLPRGTFQMSYKLQELYLNKCSLTSFAFSGDTNQRHQLGVGNTEIDGTSSKYLRFHDQHQMKFIDLEGNELNGLTQETIVIDWNVNTLILTGNPIQTVDPDTISSLHVKWLQFGVYPLSLEVIKNITLGVSKSTVIEKLDIQFSNITYIPFNLFEHLCNKSLASLSLEGNDIVFYPGVFKDLPHVASLDLLLCGFEALDPRYFDGMTDLRVLHASSKQLRSVNPRNRTWSINLDELFLGLFQCIKLNEYALRGLQNLTKLFLTSDNKDEKYKQGSFVVNQTKLQYFNFDPHL